MPEIFPQIPLGVHGDLDADVCGVAISIGWDLECEFAAAVQLPKECFAVEQPRIGQLLGALCVHRVRLWWVFGIFQTSLTSPGPARLVKQVLDNAQLTI